MLEYVRWATRLALGIAWSQGKLHLQDEAVGEALLALSLAWKRHDPARGPFPPFAAKRVAGAVRRLLAKDRKRQVLEVVFESTEEFDAGLDAEGDAWACAMEVGRGAMAAIATTYQLGDAASTGALQEDLRDDVAQLDPEERALVELRYEKGMAWEEVAAALGIKERAAKYRDAAVRRKLRDALGRRSRTDCDASSRPASAVR